jgi:cytidine deaminase
METLGYQQLDEADRRLIDAAREATATAYAPYSGVAVGAALRTGAHGIVTGANVENASYGATVCAERVAIGRAHALGGPAFDAIAITATGRILRPDQVVSPCGICRQVLHEVATATGSRPRILMTTPETDRVTVATLPELLPLPFHALGR